MLKRIKNKLGQSGKRKELLDDVLTKLEQIRKKSSIVALYGSPTGGNWLGIANATKGLYKDIALEIPQEYSNPVFTEKEITIICQKITDLSFEKVIISGFAFYFFGFIDRLYTSCRIETLFHGTISEFHDPLLQKQIKQLIHYGRENRIHHLAFVRKGLEKVFQELYGLETSHLPLETPHIPPGIELIKTDKSKINIGVFGGDTFNKNLHNQVIYALMNPNTIVHVLDKSMFTYLDMGTRIVEHGKNLPKDKFLSVIGAMDLNLYMSYSESWGLVAYESEAMGVPCLRLDDIDYYKKIETLINSVKRN